MLKYLLYSDIINRLFDFFIPLSAGLGKRSRELNCPSISTFTCRNSHKVLTRFLKYFPSPYVAHILNNFIIKEQPFVSAKLTGNNRTCQVIEGML